MTVEQHFYEWWPCDELPEMGFDKTAMLDFAESYCNALKKIQPKPTCDVCGSENLTEAPHMGRNCNDCHPI
jgi:hypothetical protein